jgi:hypothetical protein
MITLPETDKIIEDPLQYLIEMEEAFKLQGLLPVLEEILVTIQIATTIMAKVTKSCLKNFNI